MSQYDMAYDWLHVDVYVSVFVMEDYESLVIVQNWAENMAARNTYTSAGTAVPAFSKKKVT